MPKCRPAEATLAVPAATARQGAWAARLGAYWALTKSLQTVLLLITGLAGYISARPPDATPGRTVLMLCSLLAAIGGTTALNMVVDRDIDARMQRTARRPLPAGVLSPRQASAFGGVLALLGLAGAFWLGVPFGLAVSAGVVVDLGVYTLWLKRRSAWAILFGGVAGGMPILAGRMLSTGRVDILGLLLALSVVLWIPTHIMTFAMKHADDYRRVGVPTWPNTYGFDAARRAMALANALRTVTLVGAGWLLRICPWSLALLGASGVIMVTLSLLAAWRPTERTNFLLFKFASLHMLGSMVLLTLGALL